MSVINTNIKALVAQDSMVKVNRSLSTAMERLSTGSRINTAADDAAGLSITTRMDSQVRGLSQAIRNANDGISIVQTTEGALDEVTTMLQRMRELSVQSVNASNNADDRASLDAEVQQLKTEIDRVATTTQFNNMNLLDGSFKNKVLQIGDKAGQTMDISQVSTKTVDLGRGTAAGAANSLISARIDFETVSNDNIVAGAILINDVALGAFVAGTDDLSDIIKDINAKVAGVKASGFNVVVADQIGSGVLANGNLTIAVQGHSDSAGLPTPTSYAISASDSLQKLVDNINAEAGGQVQASINSDGKLQLTNDTGSRITITLAGAGTGTNSGFSAGNSFQGFLKLESVSGDPISVKRGTAATALSALSKIGFNEVLGINPSDGNTVRGASLTAGGVAAVWSANDLKINGVAIHDPLIATNTFQGKLDTINRFTEQTGVRASGHTTTAEFTNGTNAAGVVVGEIMVVNGVGTAAMVATTVEDLVAKVNAITKDTGVTAIATATNKVVFQGNVARIDLQFKAAAEAVGTSTMLGGAAGVTVSTIGGIQLDSESNLPISIQLAAAADSNANAIGASVLDEAFGLLEQNVGAADFDVNAASISPVGNAALKFVSVASVESSSKAIGVIDKAIAEISSHRSRLGAIENRLEKTVNNLSNIVTNTAQSRSRIKDTDYAVETTNLAKAQIIQQAATAMLAQANQQPQSVLALLQ